MGTVAAVAGQFAFDGRAVSKETVGRMATSMAHRGPDGISVWAEGPVGLAHCAMHTTPEAVHERQPLMDSLSGCVVTADARIDNQDELLRKLKVAPADGEVVTDIDLILAAYLRWGTAAPEHLIGDFAFAIWDPREQHLFCARDHIGIKPFYYYLGRDFCVFGTEIKSLHVHPEVPRIINDDRAAEYITRQPIDPEATMFQNILRLPPAHGMTVRRDGTLHQSRYWQLDPDYELVLDSDEEYEQAFREVFTEAVRCRLRSNGPVGVMLSGGLDSSSVACVARDLLQDRGDQALDTFTAEFGYERADESAFLDSLRKQGGFRMHAVPMQHVDPVATLRRTIEFIDQPPFICNTYMMEQVGEVARKKGIRTLLDGCEGDITMSYGDGLFGELVLAGEWSRLQRELMDLSKTTGGSVRHLFIQHATGFLTARAYSSLFRFALKDVWKAAPLHEMGPLRILWGYGIRPRIPEWILRVIRRPSVLTNEIDGFEGLIDERLRVRSRLYDRIQKTQGAIPANEYSERRRHWHSLHVDAEQITAVLEETSHLHAMVGGEARHPFYDIRFIQFCLSLPSGHKLRNGLTRSIIRRALRKSLPSLISNRMTKGDLGDNFSQYVRASPAINKMLENDGTLRGYFDSQSVRRAAINGKAAELWTALGFSEWRSLSFNYSGDTSKNTSQSYSHYHKRETHEVIS